MLFSAKFFTTKVMAYVELFKNKTELQISLEYNRPTQRYHTQG